MLECVAVVLGIIIEVIRVSEEISTRAECIRTAQVRSRQTDFLRFGDLKDVPVLER